MHLVSTWTSLEDDNSPTVGDPLTRWGRHDLALETEDGKRFHLGAVDGQLFEPVWNPTGTYLSIYNRMGSNVAECLVVRANRPVRLRSVDVGPLRLIDATSAHFYVGRGAWAGNVLSLDVSGHTDFPPVRDFHYRARYDADRDIVTAVPAD